MSWLILDQYWPIKILLFFMLALQKYTKQEYSFQNPLKHVKHTSET